MKTRFKPKEVLVNLPVVHTFDYEDEIPKLAAAFNTFVHGKVKMKYEVLGTLGPQLVAIFYWQRNHEFQELRDEFMKMIEAMEMGQTIDAYAPQEVCGTCWNDVDECACSVEPTPKKQSKKSDYSKEEIQEMRERGILIDDNGVFCREVPECFCGLCRPDYGDWRP